MSESGSRAVPYYCPFCASEDLWPAGATHGTWECRSCTRTFTLKFVGVGVTGTDTARTAEGGPR